ncbi:hypothetical protein BKA67DRAFT_661782 [Truncatella angustata]|uniref:Uncharacterized protein n=1 Tax=Truncatella angustata TaxID=152316 RepID=A0A9P8ZTZ0_9PEZI|nr:uncharacterized protein BKA67DRAFT_661782 [Truncatella angustata]KAH6648831.1 hypothetical protein BKA67DRAFT_661782 [Truncatella angustata]
MSSNPPPLQRPAAARPVRSAGPTIASTSSSTGNGSGNGNGNVRRNLFQSQLTRRPTPTSSNSGETLRLDVDVLDSEASEIVIRDKNGEFEVGDPPTPPMDEGSEAGAVDEDGEHERERRKLAEIVRHHQKSPAQPEEILEALRASMRAQVTALADDNWMYEPEDQPRPQ